MAPLYAVLFVSSMAVISIPNAQSYTLPPVTGEPGLIGCYRDGNPRIMGTQRYGYESVMTAEACSLLCDGYEYFGTQYGSQCFCGDASTEFDMYCGDTNCDDVVCDMPCAGDSNEICGGRWAMSVYETTVVEQTCGNGVPGIIGSDEDGFPACCPLSCSSCDYECGAGDSDCCPSTILTTQELCSVSASAPCAIYDPCEVGPCEDGTECHAVALGGSDPLEAVCVPVGCTVEFPQYVGDGECDSVEDGYNTEACGYDGGDCCEQTCTPAPTSSCGDFNCLDPDYAIDLDYSKLGCAEDPNPGPDGGRLLSVGPFQADVMSAEICYGICEEELPGFDYFGTQWGIECFCATTLRDEVSFDPEHDGCDYTCAGSTDDEICGGRDAVTVYQVAEVDEPDIYEEIGCAEDPNPGADGGRLMPVGPIQRATMSAEICYGLCEEELPGFTYFGTQWSIECWCSQDPPNVSSDPSHDGCIDVCAGSTDGEICGGTDALTIYYVIGSE